MTLRFENLTDIIKNSQTKLKEQFASALIKETYLEKGNEKSVSLSQSAGSQPLAINIGSNNTLSNTSNEIKLTAENLTQIQTSYNLSMNTTLWYCINDSFVY